MALSVSPTMLQQLPWPLMRAAFQAASALLLVLAYYQLMALPETAFVAGQAGGYFQYLTVNSLALAVMSLGIGAGADFSGIQLLGWLHRQVRSVALPLACVVSVAYTFLILLTLATASALHEKNPLTPELPNLPKATRELPYDYHYPLGLDALLHGIPAVALLLSHRVLSPRLIPLVPSPLPIGFFSLAFAAWIERCAAINGEFPYQFLTNLPFTFRLPAYLILAASTAALNLHLSRPSKSMHSSSSGTHTHNSSRPARSRAAAAAGLRRRASLPKSADGLLKPALARTRSLAMG